MVFAVSNYSFRLDSRANRRLGAAILIALVAALAAPNLLPLRAADDKPTDKPSDKVDFARDVKPILHDKCVKCHAGTQKKGAFSINSRSSLVAGGESGVAVRPGKSADSELIRRVSSADANLRMPPEGPALDAKQIGILTRWIDQGATWEDGFAFAKEVRRAPLAPRRPALPPLAAAPANADVTANPIDRLLAPYFTQHRVDTKDGARPVSDRVFLRRASRDLVGLLPSPAQLDSFEKDVSADKRAKAVAALLADRRAYADHWLTFWNDALRNAYRGTGFIDGGRRQISGWLYRSLHENKPYDRFVHELISPPAGVGADGFTWGIVWRGVVNESQRREIQNAQNISQVFLGTNLKCASCHDSFVNSWKLTDAYALASVFSEAGPLEIHRCDKPTGERSTVGFLYPELGPIDGAVPKAERMKRLADLMIDPRNGRLTRTIVNRLWARLMGRGLVEPVDDMDAEPWHQDLLDFLATDLVDHQYDLKRTLALIATSQAYQRASVEPLVAQAVAHAAGGNGYVFRGPLAKRMTAEQFIDAARTVTGVWPTITADLVTVDGRGQDGQLLAVAEVLRSTAQPSPTGRVAEKRLIDRFVEAKWIWSHANALSAPGGETIFARKVRQLAARPARAIALLSADNSIELFVNGKSLAKNDNWEKPILVDVTTALHDGENVFALKAANGGAGPNPAGAIAAIAGFDATGKLLWSDLTDATWSVSTKPAERWTEPGFDPAGWTPAVVIGDAKAAPWGIAARAKEAAPSAAGDVAAILGTTPIRAALTALDPLQSSLGRPNREQVVTMRDSRATMLQALELSNGTGLDALLQAGAAKILADAKSANAGPAEVVAHLYRIAFGRSPRENESRLALELAGNPLEAEGLADLLWTIVLSPEFQIVE